MPDRKLRVTLTVEPEDPTENPFDPSEISLAEREAVATIVRQATQQIARVFDDPAFATKVLASRS